ncbi:MAG: MBL fold metallo-hydrolase [Polyangia bacterium]
MRICISKLLFLAAFFACGCGSGEDGEPDSDREPGEKPAEFDAKARVEAADDAVSAPRAEPAAIRGTKVVVLGSGTPVPNPDRSGPATVVIAGGRPYIVDAGPGIVRRAAEAARRGVRQLDPRLLDTLFLTHLHSDHTAGLPDLWLTPAAVGRPRPLHVFGPPGSARMARHLEAAWSEDLAVRTEDDSPGRSRGYGLEVEEIEPGVVFEDENVKVTAFAVDHGSWEHAYGYRFDAPDRSVVVSGDTAPVDSVVEACDGCDVLVHEVYCEAGWRPGPPSWRRYHATHHTSAPQLAEIASRAKPELLVLTHLLLFGCSKERLLSEVTAGYDGEVWLPDDLQIL